MIADYMLKHDCLLHINADMTADYMLRHDCLLHIIADMVTGYMLRHDCQVTYQIRYDYRLHAEA